MVIGEFLVIISLISLVVLRVIWGTSDNEITITVSGCLMILMFGIYIKQLVKKLEEFTHYESESN
jgi:hypothetical protein